MGSFQAVCPVCKNKFLANYEGRVCCSADCAKELQGSFSDRFWQRVRKGPDCWEWIKPPSRMEKYPRIKRNGEQVSAHRVSWELSFGAVTEGLCVLHRCDNVRCVRPDHLFLGTFQDNTDDMFTKGRANKAKGEKHGRAKITEEDARQILAWAKDGELTQVQIAEYFGLHPVYVNKLIKGHKWAHLQQG